MFWFVTQPGKDSPQKILVCNLLVIFFVKEKALNDIFVCFCFFFLSFGRVVKLNTAEKKRFLLILCYAYFNVAWMVAWITGIFSFDIFFHNPGYYPGEQNVSNSRVILNHLLLISWLNNTLYRNLFYSVEVWFSRNCNWDVPRILMWCCFSLSFFVYSMDYFNISLRG